MCALPPPLRRAACGQAPLAGAAHHCRVRAHRLASRLSPSQKRLQALPHTAPLTGAVICIALLGLPLEDAIRAPLFQFSIVGVTLAAFGFVVTTVGNDYSHWRSGLLRPQKTRTVLLVAFFGVAFAIARFVHLVAFGEGDHTSTLSTEHLQVSGAGGAGAQPRPVTLSASVPARDLLARPCARML